MTIYISEPIHPRVLEEIGSKARLFVGFGLKAVAYEEIADQVDAVMLRSEKFPASRVDASPRLKVIARHGVGVDTVDVDAATKQGIVVTYCPGGNSNAVAEHVFSMLLALARKIKAGHDDLVAGPWPKAKQHLVGEELYGRGIGIVGFGEIGKIVCRIAKGFGMNVLVSDPFLKESDVNAYGASLVEFEELLKRSQVVSLHAPLTASTKGLINARTLAMMPPDAIVVNTARSGLVDEPALASALQTGQIAGAALDVIDAEQGNSASVTFGGQPIAAVPNLLVTPHVAGQTIQSLLNVGTTAWHDIQAVTSGAAPRHPFNSPANPR